MLEDVLLLASYLVEVVHVQLPHERGEVLVPEVDGQDLLLELLDVLDVEIVPQLAPHDDVGVLIFLHDTKCTSRIS